MDQSPGPTAMTTSEASWTLPSNESLGNVFNESSPWAGNLSVIWDIATNNISSNASNTSEPLPWRERLKLLSEYWAWIFIGRYKIFPLVALALIGNGLAIITLLSAGGMRSTWNILMINLAVWDTLYICLRGTNYFLGTFKGFQDTSCQFIIFLQNVAVQNAILGLVVMTVNRFIAIRFPWKSAHWCTLRRTVITLIAFLVFSAVFNMVYFVIVKSSESVTCGYKRKYVNFSKKIWIWISTMILTIVPGLVILTLNIVIIISLRKRARKRHRDIAGVRGKNKTDHLTPILLTVSIIFLLLTTPITCLNIIRDRFNRRITPASHMQFLLMNTVFRMLADLNHCINFFLYFISGPSFRKDFMKLFACCRKKTNTGNMNSIDMPLTSMTV